jgi:uncharacterized protein (TIGR02996 family)
MSDEDAFIRALRERPDDETTRLVYTDWLDDRSDPRAEYLRTEAAWVALQPSDEQYRPLYRRVSQLAAGLEPEWFATVRRAWDALPSDFRHSSRHMEDVVPDSPGLWRETASSLWAWFAEAFGEDEADQRFCLPADFVAFNCVINRPDWYRRGRQMVEILEEQVTELGLNQALADEFQTASEMWLHFGQASDASWHCVCCDLGSPRYGVIAECSGGVEEHLWLAESLSTATFCGRNLLHFLTDYLEAAYNSTGYHWPHIPLDQWATH